MRTHQATINDYTIRVTHVRDKASPFDPSDWRSNTVRITNNKTQQQTVLVAWSDEPHNKSEVLMLFYKILMATLMGAQTPQEFFAAMQMDITHKDSEAYFKLYRGYSESLACIMINMEEVMKTLHMIASHIGFDPTVKHNGKNKL